MKRILTLFIITTFIFACEPEIDDYKPSSGDADFSTYVALGNSLTAGFMNGELYRSGQQNAYPLMLADKFANVGGGDFKQPLMKDDLGFGNRRVLGSSQDCTGDTSLVPVPAPGDPNPQNFTSIAEQGPFNNMGVPGAKSFHLVAEGYGQLNPYFGRFMSDANTSVLSDAMANNPTFFTLWIGNNDVLGYALEGGEADSITGTQFYAGVLQSMLQTLTSEGAKGAIANIPDVTDIPYFNTVPYNALTLSQERANILMEKPNYQQHNQEADSEEVDSISFEKGANALVIEDNSAPQNVRQIKDNELVLLDIPLDSVKCHGMGSEYPVPEEYVLDEEEIGEISQAVNGYNQTITAMADQFNLAKVDMAATMKEAKETGLRYDGVGYTTEFISGGLFSLDGIHLTGQGYAIVANKFISAINAEYNAEIPTVSVSEYSGIQFP